MEFLFFLMGLGPSVVLCRSQVGTVRIHIMARTNQLSKEKQQSIITLRTDGQSVDQWKSVL